MEDEGSDDETAALVIDRRSPADERGAVPTLRAVARARRVAPCACALALVAVGAALGVADRYALRPWLELALAAVMVWLLLAYGSARADFIYYVF